MKNSDIPDIERGRNLANAFEQVARPEVYSMDVEPIDSAGGQDEQNTAALNAIDNQRLINECEIHPQIAQQPRPSVGDARGVEGAFGARMDILFNRQNNEMRGMAGVLDRKWDVVKTELKADMEMAGMEREKDGGDFNVKYNELVNRIAKVELPCAQPGVAAGAAAASTWHAWCLEDGRRGQSERSSSRTSTRATSEVRENPKSCPPTAPSRSSVRRTPPSTRSA